MNESRDRESYVSGIFVILLLVPTVTSTSCDELQCLNSNPCQSRLTRDTTTHAQCICGGKWAGPRCQYQLLLKMDAVTSSTVKLKVDLTTSQDHEAEPQSTSEESASSSFAWSDGSWRLNYTIVYWENKDVTPASAPSRMWRPEDLSCVLLHDRVSQHPFLHGLLPSLTYTVCVESGFMDSCILSSFLDPFSPSARQPSASLDSGLVSRTTSSWPSNCVTFRTRDGVSGVTTTSELRRWDGVVVVGVVMLAVVVGGVVVMVVRRCTVAGGRLMREDTCPERCGASRRWCCCGCPRGKGYTYLSHSQPHKLDLGGQSGTVA